MGARAFGGADVRNPNAGPSTAPVALRATGFAQDDGIVTQTALLLRKTALFTQQDDSIIAQEDSIVYSAG